MATEISLYIVLDANILINDFWMTGPSFSYLLAHHFLGHRPMVPEVAFQEARNHLRERAKTLLSNRVENVDGSQGNTLRLMRLFNYKKIPKNPSWNIDKLLTKWDKFVRGTLGKFNGQILPNPSLDVEQIVKRSIARKKPFSKGDRGFRDTIIWLSTLALVGPNSGISFVTSNTQDFFLPNSDKPHPEILDEAKQRLIPGWKMQFHRSLDEFITKFDSDRSSSSEALQRALISNNLSGFDLWGWVEQNLLKIVGKDEFDEIPWAGVPYHAEAPTLVGVEELISMDIPRIKHIADDIYRIYCDIAFIGHFSCDIAFSTAESVVNPNQILWKNERDSIWTEVGIRVAATFILRIDFDTKYRLVTSYFARPLIHWSSYGDAIEVLDRDYNELNEEDEEGTMNL